MDHISYLMLLEFVFGAAIGSFLNVVALRYDPDRFLFSSNRIGGPPGSAGRGSPGIGGRSHCPYCKKNLRWFELIPVVSFVIQGGRCRRCGVRISFQYPIVEIISGLIFVLVPLRLGISPPAIFNFQFSIFNVVWVVVFELLLLMSLIDLRLSIIPDEINIFLLFLGSSAIWLQSFRASELQSSLFGALFSLVFFGLIILITRGRGMGLGDLKLAIPLGLLFGWPDILLLTSVSFVVGALFGIFLILSRDKTMKSAIPFGPFLALGSAIVFFAGREIISLYLQAFHL